MAPKCSVPGPPC